MKPTARFRKFTRDHPGVISLATAVAIQAAINSRQKVHFTLLEELIDFIRRRGSRIANTDELIQMVALYDSEDLWHTRSLDAFMERLNDLIGGYGVTSISDENRDVTLTYVNTGDSYTTTIAHDGDKLLIVSWGGWVEWAESDRRPRLRF